MPAVTRTGAGDAGPPSWAAWTAAGRTLDPRAETGGWCACCGVGGRTVPAALVVSRKFTDAQSWVFGGDRLCEACGWAYATPATRREVFLVDGAPSPQRTVVARTDLGDRLAAAPLSTTQVAVVPVRGRRHILPTAQWGHVCTDDTMLRWDAGAVERFAAMRWLRAEIGAGARALRAPQPPIALLRGSAGDRWATIIARWEALQVWRIAGGCWWDAAIALSTPAPVDARVR